MIDHEGEASGIERCPLCSGDYPPGFVETITTASATIGTEMSPEVFRTWLRDETCDPES